MDKILSSVNPETAKLAAEKAGELVEGAVKKVLCGKEGENGKTEAGESGAKVEGKAGAGAKVEGKGEFGLGDALGAFQGDKKDKGKDGGLNVKKVMGSFGL